MAESFQKKLNVLHKKSSAGKTCTADQKNLKQIISWIRFQLALMHET